MFENNPSALAGHHNVGDEQVDRPNVPGGFLSGVISISRLQHVIPAPQKDVGGQSSQPFLVLG